MSEPDERILKTYVWHNNQCYFVSTILRDSSASVGGRFYETLCWKFDWNTNEKKESMGYAGGSHPSKAHFHIVESLRAFGVYPADDN